MRGIIIDCDYIIRVSDYMEKKVPLPRPRKRLLTGDNEFLPIITVEVEE